MAGQPIDIHYTKLEEWLTDRKAVLGKKHHKEFDLCLKLAPVMVQAVRYDIPALKKQLSRMQNQRQEAERAVIDAPKLFAQIEDRQLQFLSKYGIPAVRGAVADGTDIEELLEQRIAYAEKHVAEELTKECPSVIRSAFDMYHRHLATLASDEPKASPTGAADHFPWLERLASEAQKNLIVQQACREEVGGAVASDDQGDSNEPTLDWGDEDCSAVDAPAAIDIDWGNDEVTTSAAEAEVGENSHIFPPSVVAADRPTIIVTRPEHRSCVAQELSALICFFQERIVSHLVSSGIAVTDAMKQKHCAPEVDMIASLNSVRGILCEGVTAELLRMRHNFRQKEKAIASYEAMCRSISSTKSRVATSEERVMSLDDESRALTPQLEGLICSTRQQQKDCEAALQRVFPDREVMLVGDINTI